MPYKDPEVQRTYQKMWMRKRRQAYFEGKVCVNCQASDNLQLDHMDPALKVSHKIWSWTEQRRNIELAKCQPLCEPCHLEKTRYDNNWGLRHGTPNGYTRYKCRCGLCKEAHNDSVAQWRWKSRRAKLLAAGITI